MSTKETLSSESSKELVDITTRRLFDLLTADTKHILQRQQWLIMGRIIANLFQAHFGIAYASAEEMMNQKQGIKCSKHS
jgi:hypothetical protein